MEKKFSKTNVQSTNEIAAQSSNIPPTTAAAAADSIETVPVAVAGAVGAAEAPEPAHIPQLAETAQGETLPGERRHIVRSATLVMLGNLGSSLMGMVRQIVVASFGSNIAAPFLSAL